MNQTALDPARLASGCHPLVEQARQDLLDALYRRDGREDPEHPRHSTYTGLWATYLTKPAP